MKTQAKQPLIPRILFLLILTLTAVGMISIANAQLATLYDFTSGFDDGQAPRGDLTLSGSTLYGMTQLRGSNEYGVIFKMDTDGSGYTNLHKFAGGSGDGGQPFGNLTLSGSTLYGMTSAGGDSGFGVIFKMDTNGSNYTNLHEFLSVQWYNGFLPYGDLTLSGNTLYGMTHLGGSNNFGVIFKIDTNGSSYAVLHHFAGVPNDGRSPYGSLNLSGSTLYGMTWQGGNDNYGVIFKIDTNGSSHTILHHFASGSYDGSWPHGDLTLSGSTLYGMTSAGGTDDYGVIFKMDTNGSNYTNLHGFGGSDDGRYPFGSLTLSGGTLAGMTYEGGSNNMGVIFIMATNSSNYANLHHFAGGSGDGSTPLGSLVKVDAYYYGMTYSGGSNNWGVVFKLVPEPTVFVFVLITAGLLLKVRRGR